MSYMGKVRPTIALLTDDIADDQVTSAKIADTTIVDADVNASAAIAKTKLASLDVVNADVNASAAIVQSKLATLAIDTAELVDNGVTLGKLEDGTQGDILYYGASGAPARLGFGTSGDFLKTQGTGANPVWASAGSPGIDDNSDATAMTITSAEFIGIGTADPQAKLHVDDGWITLKSQYAYRSQNNAADGTIDLVHVYGSDDDLYLGQGNDSINLRTADSVRMTIDNSGNTNITGALSKGSGSFTISHPLPEKNDTHNLVHSFIEGPKADLIYRGKVALVNGSATVNIDSAAEMSEGTFVLLCDDVQCFTSNETDWDCVRGNVVGNVLTIDSQDSNSSATISWMVVGDRKDEHIMETDWTDENGKPIVETLKPEPKQGPE